MVNGGIFYDYFEYFMAIWYILWSLVIFSPIWNVWTKKNLATLAWRTFQIHFMERKPFEMDSADFRTWSQSYDHDLQRQGCKNLQHE
jgi:hypothetical protein